MNIAVMGGSFDPPHYGHQLVARQVLEVIKELDEVWFLPANTNPDKKIYASPRVRLAMTNFLIDKQIRVSDIDIVRRGETYTFETVKILLKNSTNHYWWIIGSDLVKPMQKWQGYPEIVSSIPIIVFPRPEYLVAEKLPASYIILPTNKLLTANYSSTKIRERIAGGLSINGLVPDRVAEYISSNRLYLQ